MVKSDAAMGDEVSEEVENNSALPGDMTAVPIWSEQPHYKHHSIRLKCEERVTCLLQWKGVRMSV